MPQEVPVERIDNATWRLPNAGAFGAKTVVDVEGTLPYYPDVALCVATDDEADLSLREKVFSVDTDVFVPVDTMGAWNDEVLKAEGKPVLVLFAIGLREMEEIRILSLFMKPVRSIRLLRMKLWKDGHGIVASIYI